MILKCVFVEYKLPQVRHADKLLINVSQNASFDENWKSCFADSDGGIPERETKGERERERKRVPCEWSRSQDFEWSNMSKSNH